MPLDTAMMLLPVLLAAAAATATATAAPCSNDTGCSLNGVCAAGRCRCVASWGGPTCSSLRLLPAVKRSGLQSVDDGRPTSSWGGVVNALPSGGWGMVASEMLQHCGIDSWTRNSRIVFATSTTPGGTYTRRAQIEGTFAHEPSIARAPNGTWVMYFARHFPNSTASGGYAACNCTDGSTPTGACHSEVAGNNHVTFMATATELGGPWSAPRMIPLLDCNLVRRSPLHVHACYVYRSTCELTYPTRSTRSCVSRGVQEFCQHDMVLAGTILPNGTALPTPQSAPPQPISLAVQLLIDGPTGRFRLASGFPLF
jgi:hypothetical protein